MSWQGYHLWSSIYSPEPFVLLVWINVVLVCVKRAVRWVVLHPFACPIQEYSWPTWTSARCIHSRAWRPYQTHYPTFDMKCLVFITHLWFQFDRWWYLRNTLCVSLLLCIPWIQSSPQSNQPTDWMEFLLFYECWMNLCPLGSGRMRLLTASNFDVNIKIMRWPTSRCPLFLCKAWPVNSIMS